MIAFFVLLMNIAWGAAVVPGPSFLSVTPAGCPQLYFPSTGGTLTCRSSQCVQCNIYGAVGNTNTINCEDNSCAGAHINCPAGANCDIFCSDSTSCSSLVVSGEGTITIECTASGACNSMSFECGSHNPCMVTCSSSNSCELATLSSTGGYLGVDCSGSYGCKNASILCPATDSCDVECFKQSGNKEGNCKNAKILQPPNSSGALTLKCKNEESCKNALITCPELAVCKVTCEEDDSCELATVQCPTLMGCEVECKSDACRAITVKHDRGQGGSLTMKCTGSDSCVGSTVDCGQSCSFLCHGDSGCIDSFVACGSATSCSFDCPGDTSCNGIDITTGWYTNKMCANSACTTGDLSLNWAPTDAPATTAPATPAPATPSPATNAPSTPAPETTAPETLVPGTTSIPTAQPTSAPATGVPSSGAPATSAPTTNSPPTRVPGTTSVPTAQPTSAPATDIPDTMTVVPTALPAASLAPATSEPSVAPEPTNAYELPSAVAETEGAKKAKQASKAAGSAAVASSLLVGGTGVGNAGKMALFRSFGCNMEDVDIAEEENLDWEFHPSRIPIGNGRRKYMVGAGIMNVVITVCCMMLMLAVSCGIKMYMKTDWQTAMGMAKSPGLLFIPYFCLLQGTSLVAARLSFFPDSAGSTILGWGLMLLCFASPVVLWVKIIRRIPEEAVAVKDPMLHKGALSDATPYSGWRAALYRFVFGEVVWVSKRGSFAEQYGLIFELYKEGHTWFIIVEVLVVLFLSVLSTWRPSTPSSCNGRNFMITLMMCLYSTGYILLRPFAAPFDNILGISLAGMMTVSVFLMSIGITRTLPPTSPYFTFSGYLLFVSAIILMSKSSWELITYGFDVAMGRRAGVRFAYNNLAVESEMQDFDDHNTSLDSPHSGPGNLNSLLASQRSSVNNPVFDRSIPLLDKNVLL